MEQNKKTPYSHSGDKEEDEILLLPLTYILQIPGKQIRGKLIQAFNYWLKIPQDKFNAVADIIQLLHTSSLLLDDIQDNSVLRRGIPVAHNIYGIASTINASNYGIFIALEKVMALNHPEGIQVYLQQLLELHRGQGMELYWRDNYVCPSETAYKQMIIRKTGGLFNMAIRLMQLFSDSKEDYSSLVSALGLYFQIRDDYCNLSLKEYALNKSYCDDLSEGKFSFPIIHALRTHPEDRQILSILKQRTKDNEVKRYCVSLLEKFGSFTYTRTVLEDMDKEVRKKIQCLGGNPLLVRLLDELMSWKHDF
ncbi:terpene synthase [Bombus pascuorum]|uniref:terpene synthase n=1 Tax=Bombus pascuorum TaxID=65598 RepID=UPI002141319A|nr:terpene synthase [Bombus pascuorum]